MNIYPNDVHRLVGFLDNEKAPTFIGNVELSLEGRIRALLKITYEKGRYDAYANQRAAARINGPKGGRPRGSKDKSGQPRTRRSKAEIKQQEVKL